MPQFNKLTVSEAKLHLSDYLLDTLGFEAETLIDKINHARDIAEIQATINFIAQKTSPKYAKSILTFWNELLLAIKRGKEAV